MNITLISGRVVDTEVIEFDPATHLFTLNGQDITDDIKRNDKRKFVGFSDEAENLRWFKKNNPNAPDTSSTSTLGLFWDQITTDPLDAPLDALDAGVNKILGNTSVKIILGVVAVGVVAYIFYRVTRR